MQDIFALYRPMTGLGFKLRIEKAWGAKSGIPAATGDCCAPKLLQEANRLGYQVLRCRGDICGFCPATE